jgi:hypothetical protein
MTGVEEFSVSRKKKEALIKGDWEELRWLARGRQR